jgi:hypothetical protein
VRGSVLALGFRGAKRVIMSGGFSRQSKHLHFNLYRCTEFVTYTTSSVFAMGYAISGVLAPLGVADSRVPKPWREADRGRTSERARYPGPPDARRRTQRGKAATRPEKLTEKQGGQKNGIPVYLMGFLFIFLSLMFLSADLPLGFLAGCDQSRLLQCRGCHHHSRAEVEIPGGVGAPSGVRARECPSGPLCCFAAGRERTNAYSILVPTSGWTLLRRLYHPLWGDKNCRAGNGRKS